MSRRLTVAAARAALDKAKARGRRDEIAAASGRLAGALSRERAASPEAKALRGAAAAAKAATKVAERAEAKAQRTGADRDRRSAASLKGWATRRQRELEQRRTGAAPPKPTRPGLTNPRIYALSDDGGLFPARRGQLSADEVQLAAVVRDALQPGKTVFGGGYVVADTFDAGRYWIAATVSTDAKTGRVQWRWTPRALNAADAMADVEALDADYNEAETSIVVVVALS